MDELEVYERIGGEQDREEYEERLDEQRRQHKLFPHLNPGIPARKSDETPDFKDPGRNR